MTVVEEIRRDYEATVGFVMEVKNYYRTGRGWSLYPPSLVPFLHTISSWAEGGEVLPGFAYSGHRRTRKGGGRVVRAHNPSTFP